MSETIEKPLDFTVNSYGASITATIIAHKNYPGYINKILGKFHNEELADCDDEYIPSVINFLTDCLSDKQIYSWHLFLYLPGSDRRHLPGQESLNPYKLHQMLVSLKSAYKKMVAIAFMNIDGEYKKHIESKVSNPSFSVVLKEGEVYLEFWLESGGKYMHNLSYNTPQVKEIILVIESVFEIGDRLASDLEILSD